MEKALPNASQGPERSEAASPSRSRLPQSSNRSSGHTAQAAAVANSSFTVAAQLSLSQKLQSSPRVEALRQLAGEINGTPGPVQKKSRENKAAQSRAGKESADATQTKDPVPLPAKPALPSPNNTGLPAQLKAGVEGLSGVSLDDVSVHYNSAKPAQLNALAYTQGSEIHVGPGQEKHLAHEAWHVVQQKQGRVRPTVQARGAAINDDANLESEAETMGGKAAQSGEGLRQRAVAAKPAPGTTIQRKVGFEFETGIPVRSNDGAKVKNKTEVGEWQGTKLVVDNSPQLAGLTDGVLSCVEMVTPPFDEPPFDRNFARVEDIVGYIRNLGMIAEGMKDAVTAAHGAAKRGEYREDQDRALVRHPTHPDYANDELYRDLPTLVPDDERIADMMTRHGLIYFDYRLGLLSRDPDHDIARVSTSASVQATVGIDLEHIEQLFTLAQDESLIQGFYGPGSKGEPERGKGTSSYIITVLDWAKIASGNIALQLEKLDKKAEHYYNLKGLLSIMALYLIAGEHFDQGQSLLKNFSPIISRSGLDEVHINALSKDEQVFVKTHFKSLVKIVIGESQREPGDQLIKKTEVPLTCLQMVEAILSGKGDPVMEAIKASDAGLSGAGMGTTIDVQKEAVGPATRAKKEKVETPKGAGGRRIGPALELRALKPVKESAFLAPRQWEAFARYVLTKMFAINNLPTKNKEGCFLTTACVQARGLPDNCHELTTLRAFRDGYLRDLPQGTGLIREYYAAAPGIVQRLKAEVNYPTLIEDLYDCLVLRSVRFIEAGENAAALENYMGVFAELKTRYA